MVEALVLLGLLGSAGTVGGFLLGLRRGQELSTDAQLLRVEDQGRQARQAIHDVTEQAVESMIYEALQQRHKR